MYTNTRKQVYCATCLADIQSWVQFSSKLHTDTQRALPARVAIENRAIWERDFERLNGGGPSAMAAAANSAKAGGAGGAAVAGGGGGSNKAHVLQTAFGLPGTSHLFWVVGLWCTCIMMAGPLTCPHPHHHTT
jgi:hypothetical protein